MSKVLFAGAAHVIACAALLVSCGGRDGQDGAGGNVAPPAPLPAPRSGGRATNVILVTIESLRADHVGFHGYKRATTPALDELARSSIAFKNAFAVTSWTLTSHATLFTGLYPGAHRVIEPRDRLGEAATTAAELLRDHGFQTAGVVSGPYLRTPYGLNQGFELWDDSIAPDADHIDDQPTNPGMEASVRRFFESQRDPARPFFLFLYFWDPHYAYLPPPPYDSMFVPAGAQKVDLTNYDRNPAINATMPRPQLDFVVSQYDGEIRSTDDTLGRIFALLKSKGLWDETALVVTADHGEEFFDHGQKGHKNNLYAESLHVPLLVKPAGRTQAGAAVKFDARVANGVDVFPTLMELAGIEYDGPVHGRSLLAPDDPARPTFHELVTTWYFATAGSPRPVRRSDSWQAVRVGDSILFTIDFHEGRHERRLYDLESDPREQKRLEDPARADALYSRLESWRRDMMRLGEKLAAPTQAQLDAEEEKRLRAMGYIKDK